MKRELKTITPEMIREYFGQSARITSFAGRYTVKTAGGGEVKISQTNINPVYGGADVYRASVLLANEAWGGGKVNGPADFKLAALAHAENEGVNMRVAESGHWTRMIVAFLVAWIGIAFSGPGPGPFVWLFVGGVVWLLMKWVAKRRAQHETGEMGFPFPTTGGDAREASDEDLKKGEWL
jgi:hypothetical protein